MEKMKRKTLSFKRQTDGEKRLSFCRAVCWLLCRCLLFILPANPHGRRVSCVCLFPHLLPSLYVIFIHFTFSYVFFLCYSLPRFLSQPFLFSISIARAYLLCVQVVSVSVSVSVHDCVSFFALIAALRFIRFKAASHSFTHLNEKNILSLGALLFTTM